MIKHIPHAGTLIPAKYDNFIGNLISLKDKGAIEIFGEENALIFPVDRLICDVERFTENEPMEELGMGVCYTKNANLEPLRRVSQEERNEIIEKYYKPHHKKLEDMVAKELRSYGKCLIIDCHTYRKEPWPYEDDSKERPEIDIGFNGFSETAKELSENLSKHFEIAYNTPFEGSLKPIRYMDYKQVESIMLEIRQDVSINKAKKYIGEALRNIEKFYYES